MNDDREFDALMADTQTRLNHLAISVGSMAFLFILGVVWSIAIGSVWPMTPTGIVALVIQIALIAYERTR